MPPNSNRKSILNRLFIPFSKPPAPSPNPQPSRFLSLPGELRNEIYTHVFTKQCRYCRTPLHDLAPPALTLTSHQIRREALPIYFSVCHFKLRIIITKDWHLQPFVTAQARKWLYKAFKDGLTRHIRTLDIEISRPRISSGKTLEYHVMDIRPSSSFRNGIYPEIVFGRQDRGFAPYLKRWWVKIFDNRELDRPLDLLEILEIAEAIITIVQPACLRVLLRMLGRETVERFGHFMAVKVMPKRYIELVQHAENVNPPRWR